MAHIVLQDKHFAQGAKEAIHVQILDLLREYNVLLLQDYFHMKVTLTVSNVQLERNVLS
jgi:hypothetical protein